MYIVLQFLGPMYLPTITFGGDIIVFWRIPFYWCKGMVMLCVCRGIRSSGVLVSRKALFTLSIDTVSFLLLMSRVKTFQGMKACDKDQYKVE